MQLCNWGQAPFSDADATGDRHLFCPIGARSGIELVDQCRFMSDYVDI